MKRIFFLIIIGSILVSSAQAILLTSAGLGKGTMAATPGAAPAFVAEDTRGNSTDGVSSKVITLTATHAIGTRIDVQMFLESADTITAWYSAHVATGLSAGSTITFSFSASSFTFKMWAVFGLSNCASAGQPDKNTALNSTFGGSAGTITSTSVSPVATPTILMGLVKSFTSKTYTPAAGWTQIGAAQDVDINRIWYVYKAVTGTSAQDVGGSLSADDVYYAMWHSFK